MAKFRLLIDAEITSDLKAIETLEAIKHLLECDIEFMSANKFLTLEIEELDYKEVDITKI